MHDRHPHAVTIHLHPLSPGRSDAMHAALSRRPRALLDLWAGAVDEDLTRVLADPATGLLPRTGGWTATCTCSSMGPACRHVAATLLSVGPLLYRRPDLLLALRHIPLAPPTPPAPPELDDPSLEALFGIALAPAPAPEPPAPSRFVSIASEPVPEPEPVGRAVHPAQRPIPPAVGLVDAVVLTLVAALHGARCTASVRCTAPHLGALLLPLFGSPLPHPGALERLLAHGDATPILRAYVAQVLWSSAPRAALRRRIDQGRRSPHSPVPDLRLVPGPDGGVLLPGPGAGRLARALNDQHESADDQRVILPPRATDPDAVLQPFVAVADALLSAVGCRTETGRKRWRAGQGRTQKGLKQVFQAAAAWTPPTARSATEPGPQNEYPSPMLPNTMGPE